jgi:hypothetical protein
MQMPEKGTFRAAAWFAASICGITLVLLVVPLTAASPPIAFYSFLPAVFFMMAYQHEKAEKTIRELRERVEALEATRQPERDQPQQ